MSDNNNNDNYEYPEFYQSSAWVLNTWYKKLAYIIGWIYIALFILGFVYGFITGNS